MRSMIHDITTAIELSQYTVNDTESMSVPDFPFFFPSLSGQVKLSGSICRVSAPQGKDYFIMSPRTCWSFCWCDCQMDRCQKGLGLLRCTKCGKHRENREGKRERSATNLLLNRKANKKCGGIYEIKEMCTGM